jgi:hypothetical protein
MSRDTVEADAYFESLIARVDQAVAEDASGGSVGAKEESPMWWQLLNYHSAAGVCVHDQFDPFPLQKRVFLFAFGVLLNVFFSAIFTPYGRENALRTWCYVALTWFPLFFMMRMLLRRPDVSNKFFCYPCVSVMLAFCLVVGCIVATLLREPDVGSPHFSDHVSDHVSDVFTTTLISLTSNWAVEVVLLTACLLGENPCMRTTVDDRGYLEDAGLGEDHFGDMYTPPFEEGAKRIPSVVDV